MKTVIVRTRKNASTEFKGIPARFKYKVGDKYFPYSTEAHKFAQAKTNPSSKKEQILEMLNSNECYSYDIIALHCECAVSYVKQIERQSANTTNI